MYTAGIRPPWPPWSGCPIRTAPSFRRQNLPRGWTGFWKPPNGHCDPSLPNGCGLRLPDRDRTLGDIGYHIFRLSLGFRDAAREKRFPVAWLLEAAPAEMRDGAALARYGETVRAQLSDWFAAHPGQPFSVVVQTYYGPQSLHALLERTSWHAAQHLRQVYALLEAVWTASRAAPQRPGLRRSAAAGLGLVESPRAYVRCA